MNLYDSKRKHKGNLTLLLLVVIAAGLIVAVGYIGWDKYQESRQLQLQQAFQVGANQGLQQTVVSLFQQTNGCQVATLTFGEEQRQVIDIACLQPRG